MDKNILKIKRWKITHKKLLKFIENNNSVSGDEIRDWIAQCIVYFTEVGVKPNIIDFFLSRLEYRKEKVGKKILHIAYSNEDEDDKYEFETGIGPFVFDSYSGKYIVTDTVNRLIGQKQVNRTKMTPILVAFKVAENIFNNYEEEERIIPKSLLNEFMSEKTQGIYLAMESIQTSYEKKNSKNILASIVTTTSLILGLIPELDNIKDIGPKIKKTYETEAIYKKYNLNREVLWSLNNSRIIRNYDIHNPKKSNHTTFYEAVGYCHLLILFISSLLASGKVKI